jgi:hypothetical protein
MKRVISCVIVAAVVLFSFGAYAAMLELSSYIVTHGAIASATVEAPSASYRLLTHGVGKVMEISRVRPERN